MRGEVVQLRNAGGSICQGRTGDLGGTEGKLPAIAGNGRLARNTLEKAIFYQSRRLVAEPAAALDVLLPSDLELEE